MVLLSHVAGLFVVKIDWLEATKGFVLPQVSGKPTAGDPADPAVVHLDGRHQRIGQQHQPEQIEIELRAVLRIGGDSGGVIVRGTRD
jgi:hypothetical protein